MEDGACSCSHCLALLFLLRSPSMIEGFWGQHAGVGKVMPSHSMASRREKKNIKKERKKRKRSRGSPGGEFAVMHRRRGGEKGLRGEKRLTSL